MECMPPQHARHKRRFCVAEPTFGAAVFCLGDAAADFPDLKLLCLFERPVDHLELVVQPLGARGVAAGVSRGARRAGRPCAGARAEHFGGAAAGGRPLFAQSEPAARPGSGVLPQACTYVTAQLSFPPLTHPWRPLAASAGASAAAAAAAAALMGGGERAGFSTTARTYMDKQTTLTAIAPVAGAVLSLRQVSPFAVRSDGALWGVFQTLCFVLYTKRL